MKLIRHSGQATVEYLLILVFVVMVGVNFVNGFAGFFAGSVGNLGHVLSQNLTVGVCPQNCFFAGYRNGFRGQQ